MTATQTQQPHFSTEPDSTNQTFEHEYARARHSQLLAAIEGRIADSADHASRARIYRGSMIGTGVRAAGMNVLRVAQFTITGLAFAWSVSGSVPSAQAETAGTPVRVAPAMSEVVVEHQRVTGSLRAVSRSSVASEESGAVTRVMIDEGDTVSAGDVIARIDDARHRANWAEIQADVLTQQAIVAEREAELLRAQSDLEKLDMLTDRKVATERELRDGRTAVRVAEARLQSARLRVESARRLAELAQIRLDDLNIVAPFDGRVVMRHVEPGEWVNPGDAVVTMVSSGTIEARLEVPERFAPALAEADDAVAIRLETASGSITSGSIQAIPQVDPRARTFPVVVEFANENEKLSPGMSVTAWVPSGSAKPHITVPKDAVIRSARGAHLFVVRSGGDADPPLAVRNDVRVLFETEDRVALAPAAIAAGDLVVIEGNERLSTDTAVTVLNLDEAGNADKQLALKH